MQAQRFQGAPRGACRAISRTFSRVSRHMLVRACGAGVRGAPLKHEASNCLMAGLSSWPTDSRSSVVWYSMPSAPST